MIVLETENLTKRFGSETVVKDLNIHIKQGEVYALLGRNGAGKTTTLKMITGLIRPSLGKVILFGQGLGLAKKDTFQRVGTLIESPTFYENLTGKENLEIIASLRGIHLKDEILRVLELMDLKGEENKKVKKYSLGMKQRLGIAMAIMHEPEFIILDEPTNGLDPIGMKKIRTLIKSLSTERGVTILISSHMLSEVEQIADTIGIIDNGILIEEVSMEDIKERNKHYVKMVVSHTERVVPIIEKRFHISDFEIINEHEIRIFDIERDFGIINRELNKENILVREISMHKGNLEEYFLGITRGGAIG